MTRPKKFPTILLCFTLILAILVSGITKPGFLLPLFTPRVDEPKDTAVTFEEPPPAGNSRAFSINPEPGVTLYAEENALDTDRTFNVSRMTQEAVESLKQTIFDSDNPDLRIIPLVGWNVDAGMTEEDLMPGVFHFDVDLAEIGMPEFLFQTLKTYHISDSGVWTELAAEIDDSTLKVESRHNDAIAVCAAIVVIPTMIAGINTFLSSMDQGGNAWETAKKSGYNMYRMISLTGELPVYEDTALIKTSVNYYGETVKLYAAKGRQVYTLKYRYSDEIKAKMTRLKQIEKRLYEASYTTAVDMCKRTYGENYNQLQLEAIRLDVTSKACLEDPEYKTLTGVVFTSFNLIGGIAKIGEKMTELCLTARKYLKDVAKIKIPSYVITIYMDPEYNQSGVTVSMLPSLLHVYLRIKTEGLLVDEAKNDEILLTLTHELTHASQREYCYKPYANTKFDEATAQLIEETAYKWYSDPSRRVITTEHTLGNGKDYHFLAIEMDSYKTQTWEASDVTEMTMKDVNAEGDASDSGYIYARFLEFLWKRHGGSPDGEGTYITWDKLLGTYSRFWGRPTLSELFMKAFDIDTKGKFETYFQLFAYNIKTALYSVAFSSSYQYAFPTVGMRNKNGGVTKIINQDLTIKLRRFIPVMPASRNINEKISILIKQEPGLLAQTKDTKFVQVGVTNGEPCRHGLFYSPDTYRNFTGAGILEIDGWMQEKTEHDTPGEYSIWTLFAPKKVTPEKKNQQIRIKMPEKSDAAKADLIDGYRVTITPSRGGTKKEFYWGIGIAGKYVSVNYSDVLDQDFMKVIRSGEEDESSVNFTVSVCEYIEDTDLKKHFGPESEEDDLNALLKEMGAHDGRITITLHWRGTDDLDLHCITPKGGHIYYSNKNADGGYLDVDMNVHGESTNSIEHIYFDTPEQGEYSVYIDNFKDRTEGDVTADLIVSVEQQELMRKTVSMGGRSPTWKFKIEAAPTLREGIEYYVGSIIETADGDRLAG